MYILDTTACDSLSVLGTILFIKNLLTILSYIVPAILILLITIDITKAVMANDDSAIKNAQKIAIKRLIAGLIVFFVPIVVDAMFKLVDDNGVLDLSCYTNANEQTVNALAEAEKEKLIQDEKDRQKLIEASKKNGKALQKEIDKLRSKVANSSSSSNQNNIQGKTTSDKIANTAELLAWPKNTDKKKVYHNYSQRFTSWSQLGKARPTQAFMNAFDKAYPNHWKWSGRTAIGASCDVFVGTVVVYSGYDKKMPRGRDEQATYLPKSKKWKKVSTAKRGDICINGNHIMIYLGNKKVAQAGYNSRRFGVVETRSCSGFSVYRATK